MAFKILELAEKHPVETGIVVVVGGLAILYLLGSGSSGNSAGSSQAQAAAAYYAAQSAQNQAGDAVQIAQINANAAEAINASNNTAATASATTWSATDLAIQQSNNQTQVALAPFAVQAGIVNALGQATTAPNISSSSSSSSGGFFGLFGGSSSNTTVSANPVALSAIQELESIINGFHAGH